MCGADPEAFESVWYTGWATDVQMAKNEFEDMIGGLGVSIRYYEVSSSVDCDDFPRRSR